MAQSFSGTSDVATLQVVTHTPECADVRSWTEPFEPLLGLCDPTLAAPKAVSLLQIREFVLGLRGSRASVLSAVLPRHKTESLCQPTRPPQPVPGTVHSSGRSGHAAEKRRAAHSQASITNTRPPPTCGQVTELWLYWRARPPGQRAADSGDSLGRAGGGATLTHGDTLCTLICGRKTCNAQTRFFERNETTVS